MPVKTPDTGGATGYCLHPLDIAFSKLVAGRDQDIRFVALLMHFRMLNRGELSRLAKTADGDMKVRFDYGFELARTRLKDPKELLRSSL